MEIHKILKCKIKDWPIHEYNRAYSKIVGPGYMAKIKDGDTYGIGPGTNYTTFIDKTCC